MCRQEQAKQARALKDAKTRNGTMQKEVADKTGVIAQLQAVAATHADELRVVRSLAARGRTGAELHLAASVLCVLPEVQDASAVKPSSAVDHIYAKPTDV